MTQYPPGESRPQENCVVEALFGKSDYTAGNDVSFDRPGCELPFDMRYLLCLLVFVSSVNQLKPPGARARHPSFENLRSGIFFKDAFQEGIRGQRPTQRPTQQLVDQPSPVLEKPAETFSWSRVIEAEVIEDEIKAIKLQLDDALRTAGSFKGRGYQQARVDLTVAAMLFAIIDQYDGDVRWRKSAALARDRMARAASNAKVGTDPVYQEAKQRQHDFEDLIGGSTLSGTAKEFIEWSEICERSPLMKRLEQSQQDRLSVYLASEAVFAKQKDRIIREAQLVATMGHVLAAENMVDADDDEYADYCRRLEEAAAAIVEAARQGNYEQARQAEGEIRKSCSECHELYRA